MAIVTAMMCLWSSSLHAYRYAWLCRGIHHEHPGLLALQHAPEGLCPTEAVLTCYVSGTHDHKKIPASDSASTTRPCCCAVQVLHHGAPIGNALWEYDGWGPGYAHGGIYHEHAPDTEWVRIRATSIALTLPSKWDPALASMHAVPVFSMDHQLVFLGTPLAHRRSCCCTTRCARPCRGARSPSGRGRWWT